MRECHDVGALKSGPGVSGVEPLAEQTEMLKQGKGEPLLRQGLRPDW